LTALLSRKISMAGHPFQSGNAPTIEALSLSTEALRAPGCDTPLAKTYSRGPQAAREEHGPKAEDRTRKTRSLIRDVRSPAIDELGSTCRVSRRCLYAPARLSDFRLSILTDTAWQGSTRVNHDLRLLSSGQSARPCVLPWLRRAHGEPSHAGRARWRRGLPQLWGQ